MSSNGTNVNRAFYTVREAAEILRVNPMTLYRSIGEDAFPAVRIRGRYIVPAAALDKLIAEAAESGGCVSPAQLVAERRTERDATRVVGGEA